MEEEVAEEFGSSLEELTFNSKPHINMLTMLAEENNQFSAQIVQVIEAHIKKAVAKQKLPGLYLLDSIIKNVPNSDYLQQFSQNIVATFCGVFDQVDEKTRESMFKLRQTWTNLFPNKKLYALDMKTQQLDPAWPVTASPPEPGVSSIHVNPKFLKKEDPPADPAPVKKVTPAAEAEEKEAEMRRQLMAKQQELLNLKQQQLELELVQTKQRLAQQTKMIKTPPPINHMGSAPAVTPPNTVQQAVPPVANQAAQAEAPGARDPRRVNRDPRRPQPLDKPVISAPVITTQAVHGVPAALVSTVATIAAVMTNPTQNAQAAQPAAPPTTTAPVKQPENRPKKDPLQNKQIKTDPVIQKLDKTTKPSKNTEEGKSSVDKRGREDPKKPDKNHNERTDRSHSDHPPRRSSHRESSDDEKRSKHSSRSRSRSPRDHGRELRSSGRIPRGKAIRGKNEQFARRGRSRVHDEGRSARDAGKTSDRRERHIATRSSVERSARTRDSENRRETRASAARGQGRKTKDTDRPKDADKSKEAKKDDKEKVVKTKKDEVKEKSPEKQSLKMARKTMEEDSQPAAVDTDMRTEEPPAKRQKTDDEAKENTDIMDLFGKEDVDYRKIPTIPKLPSRADGDSPQTLDEGFSTPLKSPGHARWAKFKADHPDDFSAPSTPQIEVPPGATNQHGDVDLRSPPIRNLAMNDPLRRAHPLRERAPFMSQQSEEEQNFSTPLLMQKSNEVLKQADLQLRSGKLTSEQHRELVKQLEKLYQLQQVKMRMHDDRPGRRDRLMQDNSDGPFAAFQSPTAERRHPNWDNKPLRMNNIPPMITEEDGAEKYLPQNDPRWMLPEDILQGQMKHRDPTHEVVIDKRSYELMFNGPPRKIPIGKKQYLVRADGQTGEILIDDVPYYKIGEPIREITLLGFSHRIFFHGPPTQIWIDSHLHEVQIDAPPENIRLGEETIKIRIDSKHNQVFVDGRPVCPFGGEKRRVKLGSQLHDVQFEPPTKQILIDGNLCDLKLNGKYPVIIINGVEHGIRFDGPPKKIYIDDRPWLVPMDAPQRARFGVRAHTIAFGGPGHEVIIDGKWYELKFDGQEKRIRLGYKRHRIRLDGPAPDVKILPPVTPGGAPHENHRPRDEDLREGRFWKKRDHDMRELSGPRHGGPRPNQPGTTGSKKIMPLLSLNLEGIRGPRASTSEVPRPPMPPPLLREPVQPRGPRPLLDMSGPENMPDRPGPGPVSDRPGPGPMPDRPGPGPVTDRAGPGPMPDRPGPGPMPDRSHGPGPMPDRSGPGSMPDRPGPGPRSPIRPEINQTRGPRPDRPGFGPGPRPDNRQQGDMGPRPGMGPQPGQGPQFDRGPSGPDMRGPGPMGPMQGQPGPLQQQLMAAQVAAGLGQQLGFPLGFPGGVADLMNLGAALSIALRQPLLTPSGPNMRPNMPGVQNMGGMSMPGPNMPGGPGQQGMNPQGNMNLAERMQGRGSPHMQGGPVNNMQPGPDRPPGPVQMPPGIPNQDNSSQIMPNGGPGPKPGDQGFRPSQETSQPKPQIDVNDLFSKLVSAGIINQKEAEVKRDEQAAEQKDKKDEEQENKSDMQKMMEAEDKKEGPLQVIPDLLGFNMDKLKKPYHGILQRLYRGIQCSSCGMRFTANFMEKYREHLDWHFRQNRREKEEMKAAKFRRWYYDISDWIQFEEIGDLEERAQSVYFESILAQSQQSQPASQRSEVISCPAASGNETDDVCEICREPFEQFWDEDEEEWHLRDAVRVENKTYHPVCYEDAKENEVTDSPNLQESLPNPLANPLAYLNALTQQGMWGQAGALGTSNNQTETSTNTATPPDGVQVKTEPGNLQVKVEPMDTATQESGLTSDAGSEVKVKTEPADTPSQPMDTTENSSAGSSAPPVSTAGQSVSSSEQSLKGESVIVIKPEPQTSDDTAKS